MFWYIGLILLAIWVLEKFILHKGGFVHTLLLAAIGCFVTQFVQDRRTKAYQSERDQSPR
jgi:Family of unknown function (DUF5670)